MKRKSEERIFDTQLYFENILFRNEDQNEKFTIYI